MDNDFWALRRCLREPIPEIHLAASLLSDAADAHISGKTAICEQLIKKADISAISDWIEPIWRSENREIHRRRKIQDTPGLLPKADRVKARMPSVQDRLALLERDGMHCRFCDMPLIDVAIRKLVQSLYPEALRWGTTNPEQHFAFQCMWLQYDHIVPHSRGGDNSLDNLV